VFVLTIARTEKNTEFEPIQQRRSFMAKDKNAPAGVGA